MAAWYSFGRYKGGQCVLITRLYEIGFESNLALPIELNPINHNPSESLLIKHMVSKP